jgi:uncharacterized protein YgiM (DUF1202 family)
MATKKDDAAVTDETVQDPEDTELTDLLVEVVEYAVNAEHGLNLRERPSLDAKIIAVLPRGSGVVLDASQEAVLGWLPVRTGRLYGWVQERHLAYV